jgi:hypothetical protein
LRAPCASLLIGFGVALALSGGLPNRDLFALICDVLTSVVSATLNLFFAVSELMSRLGVFPETLRPVATVAPYSSLLCAPGGIAFEADPAFLWRGPLALGAWALAATLCTKAWVRRAPTPLD